MLMEGEKRELSAALLTEKKEATAAWTLRGGVKHGVLLTSINAFPR
jgi:hypothetical protein